MNTLKYSEDANPDQSNKIKSIKFYTQKKKMNLYLLKCSFAESAFLKRFAHEIWDISL